MVRFLRRINHLFLKSHAFFQQYEFGLVAVIAAGKTAELEHCILLIEDVSRASAHYATARVDVRAAVDAARHIRTRG
jgi:hypothetical protein